MLISFIIPMYNSEKFIKRCLESFKKQIDKNFELVIIDDGSTDNSINIVKKYMDVLDITLMQTNHVGVSEARNTGLKISNGDIIGFCDADDVVKKELVKVVRDIFQNKNPDIVYTFAKNIDNQECETFIHNDVLIESNSNSIGSKKFLKKILFSENVYGAVWNKFFSKEILIDIEFDKNLSMCEDLDFLSRVLYRYFNDIKIIELPLELYGYVNNRSSATNSVQKLYDLNSKFLYGKALHKLEGIYKTLKMGHFFKAKLFEITSYTLENNMFVNKNQFRELMYQCRLCYADYLLYGKYSVLHKIKRIFLYLRLYREV